MLRAARTSVYDLSNVPRSTWDTFSLSQSRIPFAQTTHYAEYAFACRGWEPTFVEVELDGAKLQNLVLCDHRERHVTWRFGPLVYGPVPQRGALIDAFADWLAGTGLRVRHATSYFLDTAEGAFDAAHFSDLLLGQSTTATLCGNWSLDIEALANEFPTGKVGKALRACRRAGLETITSEQEDFSIDYHFLMKQTFSRNRIYAQNEDGTSKTFREQDLAGNSVSVLVRRNADALAALNIGLAGRAGFIRKLAYSDLCRSESIPANDAALVAAAQWCKASGITRLDLPLIHLSLQPKATNLRTFKQRFAGHFEPAFEYTAREID